MTPPYEFIKYAISDGIAEVMLSRPAVLNAWHRPMRAELRVALARAQDDVGVQAIILTGDGDRAFCAGQDLNESRKFAGSDSGQWVDEWRDLYGDIRSLRKPLVCALNGVAAGSAFQVALLADVRVAHPGVRMGQPEIRSGIVSPLGLWLISGMVGHSRAVEMILSGRMMEARECLAIGLVHHLVEAPEVLAHAYAVARELAALPAGAMRLNKQRIQEATQSGFDDAMAAGHRYHALAFASGEPQEAMRSFLAKSTKTSSPV